jgi:hypothetical protein
LHLNVIYIILSSDGNTQRNQTGRPTDLAPRGNAGTDQGHGSRVIHYRAPTMRKADVLVRRSGPEGSCLHENHVDGERNLSDKNSAPGRSGTAAQGSQLISHVPAQSAPTTIGGRTAGEAAGRTRERDRPKLRKQVARWRSPKMDLFCSPIFPHPELHYVNPIRPLPQMSFYARKTASICYNNTLQSLFPYRGAISDNSTSHDRFLCVDRGNSSEHKWGKLGERQR